MYETAPTYLPNPMKRVARRKQYRARGFFSMECTEMAGRADDSSVARTYVRQSHRLLPLGGAVQRIRLERLLHPSAVPFFACPDWLPEWRTSNHTGSHSQRGRFASGHH